MWVINKNTNNKKGNMMMSNDIYKNIVNEQREYFNTGVTLDLEFRLNALRSLKKTVLKYESEGRSALKKDLNKSHLESYIHEWGAVLAELNFHIKHLHKWMRTKKVKTPIFLKPSRSRIIYEPYGVSLIFAPWNYPFQLTLMPLIGAISAGNTAIIKASELSSATSDLLERMIAETFEPHYIKLVKGDVDVATELLEQKLDFIFFTGSPRVGRIIAAAAAKNLTPLLLELGGKTPTIFTEDALVYNAVKRAIMAKIMNSGQTCVAPDYLFLPKGCEREFIALFNTVMQEFFSGHDLKSTETYSDMSKIVTPKHYQRLKDMLQNEKILAGGTCFDDVQKIEPTLIDVGDVRDYLHGNKIKTAILKEEIFGTLLPILTYENIEDVIAYIKEDEKPLALYLYSNDRTIRDKVLTRVSFGGGCVNDSMVHLANYHLPFGGVGNSGQGSYHGHYSFLAFSHSKSMLYTPMAFKMPLEYMPYSEKKLNFIKRIYK